MFICIINCNRFIILFLFNYARFKNNENSESFKTSLFQKNISNNEKYIVKFNN